MRLKKNCKKSPQCWGLHLRTSVCLWRLGAEPPDPYVVTPVYYYNFLNFVSNAKCVFYPSKKDRITTVIDLLLLFHTFAPIFHFKLCSFVNGLRNNISWLKVPQLRHCLQQRMNWSCVKTL